MNITILSKDDCETIKLEKMEVPICQVSGSILDKLRTIGFTDDSSSKLYRSNDHLYIISTDDTADTLIVNAKSAPKRVLAECVLLRSDAIPPLRKRDTDACYDIFSNVDLILPPRGNADVSTGFSITVPKGWYFTVEGRSGLGVKHRIVPFTGTIDACYIGELWVMLTNNSEVEYRINKGDRIAQLAVKEQIDMEIVIVDRTSEDYSLRGQNGFGSSGK